MRVGRLESLCMQSHKQSRIELIRPIAECRGSCSLAMDRDHLDLGIMTDPEQVADVGKLRGEINDALEELEVAARG